jgi:hypothetical protein
MLGVQNRDEIELVDSGFHLTAVIETVKVTYSDAQCISKASGHSRYNSYHGRLVKFSNQFHNFGG